MANSRLNQGLSKGGLGELKARLLFLLGAIIVFRLGSYIPVPGIDPQKLSHLFHQQDHTIVGLFNMFSGGALRRFSLFALGIMPYITASIIFQLLSAMVPSLMQLQKEGQSGQRKINQYTRYATFALALVQSFGVSKMLATQGVTLYQGFGFYLTATITLTTGTMFLMWLGEQVTERGVGNGISMIIFAGIVSGLPDALARTFEQVRQGEMQMIVLLLIAFAVLLITGFVVFIELGQRKITVNYAKRQQGNRLYAQQNSHLPLKINQASVIPPIFASSIILFPGTLASWFGTAHGMGWLNSFAFMLQPGQPLYMVLFSAAIVFFCFFYTAIVYNPKDVADNLKQSNGIIPGIRPGEQTAKYIDKVATRLTMVGAIYITLVALLPEFFIVTWNVPFYFGGTSLLIVVVVVMDFMAQVQAHLMSRRYESLMKKANTKGAGFNLLR